MLERGARRGAAARRHAGRGDALRRARLGLPARPRGAGAGRRRGDGAPRQLRPARRLRRGRAPLRGALRAARGAARGRAAAPPGGPRQPAGLGARRPLRRRGAAGAAARRDDRHRPHRRRPGRDDPLPARLLAEPPRPARACARATGGWPGRCSASPAPRPPPTARSAGSPGATTRPTPSPPTPATGSATAWCRSWRRSTRPRRANVLRTAELLRDEAEVLDALVDAELDGSNGVAPATRSRWSGSPSCRRRCAAWSSSGSPTPPPAARSPAPPATPRRSPALRRTGTAMLDLGGGVRAVVERGILRAER